MEEMRTSVPNILYLRCLLDRYSYGHVEEETECKQLSISWEEKSGYH